MTNPQTIISLIETHLPEIRRQLSPEEARTFEDQYYKISDQLGKETNPKEATDKLEEFLAQYPVVKDILQYSYQEIVPASAAFPNPSPIPSASPVRLPGSAGVYKAGKNASHDLNKTDSIREKGAVVMSDKPAHGSIPIESKWTPEVYLQFLKELVTTVLALLIVGYTVYLANQTLAFAGDTAKMTDGKDVLLLMMGVAGVVIGYYFGRVPADARATQAQQEAKEATIQSEQVSANAEDVAELAQHSLASISVASRRGDISGSLNQDVAEDVQQLESKVAELRRLIRRRR